MYLLRSLAVWLVIICVESVHGVLRTLFLTPYVADLRARQIGVFIGSGLILIIAFLFIRWIRARTTASLLLVGCVWLVLTLLFEMSLGRFVFGFSWERITSDYDIRRGGLLSFGLIFLVFSPLIAAQLRGLKENDNN